MESSEGMDRDDRGLTAGLADFRKFGEDSATQIDSILLVSHQAVLIGSAIVKFFVHGMFGRLLPHEIRWRVWNGRS